MFSVKVSYFSPILRNLIPELMLVVFMTVFITILSMEVRGSKPTVHLEHISQSTVLSNYTLTPAVVSRIF